jgi:hypothetical protein
MVGVASAAAPRKKSNQNDYPTVSVVSADPKNKSGDNPTDSMAVMLEGDKHLHMQPTPHKACLGFLNMLTDAGKPIVLVMMNPYIKWRVLEAHCISSDGSRVNWPVS